MSYDPREFQRRYRETRWPGGRDPQTQEHPSVDALNPPQ